MAHFEYSSVIAAPRKQVFEFATKLENQRLLMPGDYKIEPTSPMPKAKKGIEYEMRFGRFGISALWGFVVEEFKPDEEIRSRQTHGPFALWIHSTRFEDHGQGTLVTDLIEYDTPSGLLGKLIDDLFVRRELGRVFDFRHKKIQGLLVQAAGGDAKDTASPS